MSLLFAIRVLLSRENKLRDAEPLDDSYDNVFLTKIDQDGKSVEMKVPKVCGPSSPLFLWLIRIPG
jgi:ACS family allantoate permease-like MFS transporter